MKKLFACTTAIVLLAGGLVGCGSNGTGDSKVLETTRAVSEDGWGSTVSRMGTDTGNFTKLRCGMSGVDVADLGYGSKESDQDFTGNNKAQTMDHILHFYADRVTSFDYTGTPAEMGTDPDTKQPYSAYVDISVNGDTGELYAARYMIGVSEEDADTAAALADALFVNMSSQIDRVRDFYRK